MEHEKKAQNLEETIQEMRPFLVYTIIPLVITVAIAFIFGTR